LITALIRVSRCSVAGERRAELQARVDQAGGQQRVHGEQRAQPVVERHHAEVGGGGGRLAADDVVDDDDGEHHRHQHLQRRRDQDQHGADGEGEPVGLEPAQQAAQQRQFMAAPDSSASNMP
jgi:hypothetical protein